jgi:enterochelin esterase family protein
MSLVGPAVDATEVWFRLRLNADDIRAVRLCQEITRPRRGPLLVRKPDSSVWQVHIPRPPVDRLEYQYQLEHTDGTREITLDPHNSRAAPGPFGERSVLEFPGYRPPAWLDGTHGRDARYVEMTVSSDVLGARVPLGLWASPGLDVEREAPLLIAHDGPEYHRYSGLLRFVSAMVAAGQLPPVRVALLPPVDRDEHYAACPRYARALAREFVPVLDWLAPQPPRRYDGRSWRVGIGASLGALATLHAHRRYPGLFGGMFLQSGSFFQRHVDGLESGFPRFDRIARFVATVTDSATARRPIPVGMTCGTVEEYLLNNRRMRDALALQGYDVEFAEHRDGHNWTSWRDSLDPHLTALLRRSWHEA